METFTAGGYLVGRGLEPKELESITKNVVRINTLNRKLKAVVNALDNLCDEVDRHMRTHSIPETLIKANLRGKEVLDRL